MSESGASEGINGNLVVVEGASEFAPSKRGTLEPTPYHWTARQGFDQSSPQDVSEISSGCGESHTSEVDSSLKDTPADSRSGRPSRCILKSTYTANADENTIWDDVAIGKEVKIGYKNNGGALGHPKLYRDNACNLYATYDPANVGLSEADRLSLTWVPVITEVQAWL